MLTQIKNLIKDEDGATAVEYGLIVAAIAAVIAGIVVTVGGKVQTAFTNVSTHM
ncbi:MAG TPA: Flp family type IVb pilin [Polyangia bacterium]|jgi:pilus assembly protein Flp/PilA|nr:Flp family type IVb pilin [Polyangia bacterium]